ncbi:MAG: SPASM domain-containing protein, partial [Anaerolineales bacterium]|nr:SPASM domain-containing protein [Anaerolineales bacterium]
PCQSYYQQVGNIISDPWGSIWNHKLCLRLRERQYVPNECRECALLAECGGGCPLQLTKYPYKPLKVLHY